MTQIVHKLVAKTAKDIAGEVWEACSSNDRFHATYPKCRPFVAKWWREFIADARKALTVMLSAELPGSTPELIQYRYSQHVRDEIFEALLAEGEMKTSPPLDLDELRRQAGFEPNYANGHRLH